MDRRRGVVRSVFVVLATLFAGALPAVGAHAVTATDAVSCPWVGSSAPIAARVSAVLSRMTLGQEVALMTGALGSSYTGYVPAIGSLCIPALNFQDGPGGVGDGLIGVTQFPAPVSVAATWDTAAEQSYGQLVGSEQAAKGTTVDLGPTINIVRDPRWGRAFESIGEDPYLNGQLGAASIRGVQSTGVMADVKHLAVYNQETNRNTALDNAVVSTQTMQEIYLPAFQAAVQQGDAASVMCAYSTINGTPACQDPYTLGTVLRGEFGYGGFVVSDWLGNHSTADSANAGLAMDMPGYDGLYGGALQSAVQAGSVSQSTINTLVSQILTELFAFGLFDKPPTGSPTATVTDAANQAGAAALAEEGTVLLKNTNGILPLSASADSSIAVIGADASTSPQTDGGGSASVDSSGTITPLQGIEAAAPSGVTVRYDSGLLPGTAASLAASSSVAVVFASVAEGEGSDLSGIDLSASDNALISAVAAANPNTIVVLNTGSAVTMPWLSSVKGVLEAWYPGQQDGAAIASVLFEVGDADSAADLPLGATLAVNAAELGQPVTVTNPGPQEGPAGTAVSVRAPAADSTSGQTPTFTATGLPAGVSISTSGLINGTPTTPGTYTVDVSAADSRAAQATTSFTWTVVPSTDDVPSTPIVGFAGLCLDLASDGNADGTKVDVYTCNGTDGQQWTEEPDGTIHADGKCLSVAGGGTANGTPVDLSACDGGGAQDWVPQSDGALVNPVTGRCLDDTDYSIVPGTQAQIWSCTGAANQEWARA